MSQPDVSPVQNRRTSSSTMLPPASPTTADAETRCGAKATGAGASLATMATLGFLWGGACFGFNGIKTVFLDEGLFSDECEHGERCNNQINAIDGAWTFASAMLNVMALVNGSLSDALGLRRLCLLSSVLLMAATGAFYLVVTRRRDEYLLRYVYFALVESGMLLSFGGLALQGKRGSIRPPCSRTYDVKVVAAPTMETAFALGTLIFPTLRLVHDGVQGATLVNLYCSYFAACALLILYCACRTKTRALRRPGSGALRHVGWRRLVFAIFASLAVGANITQQGYYVATFAEQARWHGHTSFLCDVLDWGFPLMALPSLYGAARFAEHAHSIRFAKGAGRGYMVLAVLQLVWGLLSTQRSWWLQVFAVAVFVPARLLGFVHLYTCVGAFFPAEHFGIVAGSCLTLGGLCAIPASQGLRAWLVASMDPRGPNWTLTAALVVLNGLAGAASRLVRVDRPDAVAAPTTLAYNPVIAAAEDQASVELAEFFSDYGEGDTSPAPLVAPPVTYGSAPAAETRSPVDEPPSGM